jgi:hypothetical protein
MSLLKLEFVWKIKNFRYVAVSKMKFAFDSSISLTEKKTRVNTLKATENTPIREQLK